MALQDPAGTVVREVELPDAPPGVRRWQAMRGGAAVAGARVVVVGRQHGNEPVGEAVIERLVREAPGRLVAGSVTCVVANLDAAAEDRRHTVAGVDMNRLWDPDTLARLAEADTDSLCSEERRVAALAPWVLDGDAILDLHSTSRPSPIFLLFRDDLVHARIGATLGVPRMVTGVHERGILRGGLCANAGLRAGERGERLGFTLEAGQHDDPSNADRAWLVTIRLLAALGMWSLAEEDRATTSEPAVYDMTERVAQTPAGSPPWRFVGHVDAEPGAGRHGPARQLASFEVIEADELFLRRGEEDVMRAEAPFVMLMPAPTAGPGEDLFFLAQQRHASLSTRPATDDEARAEAIAIERMLDLLAWDDAQRGAVQVTTTSRRTLDLCAELVLRATRLPAGHPDRRVTIVGRGDGSGIEAHDRATLRWRHAVRRALAAGVPVRRVHLLRGTDLATLRTMLDDVTLTGGALELMVAPRQPHTLAMVVVGDPVRALETGEVRHVGAALLVEAATPEPDGDDVIVEVARAGLAGSRPSLLRAVVGMLERLRVEHQRAVLDDGLSPPGLATAPDGAWSLSTDDDVHAVWNALSAWHRKQVVASLRASLTRPVRVARGHLGARLAQIMRVSGVLDRELIIGALVRADADGFELDPSWLDAGCELAPQHPLTALPTPVIEARQVDADTFERWRGWRRYLRDTPLLPGDHGRDLDVSFDGERSQRRVARWMDEVRAQAAGEPGRWLVAIAGDGLSPLRDRSSGGWDVLWAHRRLVQDTAVHYLRVQHAQGAHLGWVLDLARLAGARPAGGSPFTMAWETEHGGSLSVMLVARRAEDGPVEPHSLEAWSVTHCAVLWSGGSGDNGYDVGLFTEPDDDERVSQELVHFGRVHVDRLLRRSSWRVTALGGLQLRLALEGAARERVAAEVAALAPRRDELMQVPAARRAGWVAAVRDLRDLALAGAVADAVVAQQAPAEAGRTVVRTTARWPGPLWDQLIQALD